MQRGLKHRYSVPSAKEFICKKCDKALLHCKLPVEAAGSPTKYNVELNRTCVSCGCFYRGQMQVFDKTQYGENKKVQGMCSSATTGCEENIICKQCHAMLVAHTIKNCIVCECKSIQKYMVLFNVNK